MLKAPSELRKSSKASSTHVSDVEWLRDARVTNNRLRAGNQELNNLIAQARQVVSRVMVLRKKEPRTPEIEQQIRELQAEAESIKARATASRAQPSDVVSIPPSRLNSACTSQVSLPPPSDHYVPPTARSDVASTVSGASTIETTAEAKRPSKASS
eukprot:TRINITY_DN46031_c0_g1_i1.p1 TRINITY_DN46031_c0_g1~~TRINITY_DN46031_c0_g1_i1.p1  ORF type:complete len:156 (-),score=20.35 TRINITY_DN46031_c0_g1_i1:95-562(-)